MNYQTKHIITIKEMRSKLGKEYANASDAEVENLIIMHELMADIVIKKIKSNPLVPNSAMGGCSFPDKPRK